MYILKKLKIEKKNYNYNYNPAKFFFSIGLNFNRLI
jgi:hypothetical protein